MNVLLLTNEYPPNIYGGAGIHVDYLSRELAKQCRVDVRCFGDQSLSGDGLTVRGFPAPASHDATPPYLRPVFGAVQRCLDFNTAGVQADIVHCHTWYTHLAGILAKQNYGVPLVITTHSLEPLRPWKREQLAGGYDFSCWVERTALAMADAVIAVSEDTKKDILTHFPVDPERIHIIHNGIDLDEYHHAPSPDRLRALGVAPDRPYTLFVGRITRQKGIIHLVDAISSMAPGFQIVLCAGAPDTPEIGAEMAAHVAAAQSRRPGIVWIREMVDVPAKIALYSGASLFCCPSVYEPFGIINLEAMACGTPVVASAVGGIKEVVVEGETGLLVPLSLSGADGVAAPADPAQFARDFAERVNIIMGDPDLGRRMGQAGRRRAEEHFSWSSIARRTEQLYQSLIRRPA